MYIGDIHNMRGICLRKYLFVNTLCIVCLSTVQNGCQQFLKKCHNIEYIFVARGKLFLFVPDSRVWYRMG